MKKTSVLLLSFLSIFAAASLAIAEQAPQKIKDLAKSKLAEYGNDPVIVKAVLAQNAKVAASIYGHRPRIEAETVSVPID
jgi:hypothetical protein